MNGLGSVLKITIGSVVEPLVSELPLPTLPPLPPALEPPAPDESVATDRNLDREVGPATEAGDQAESGGAAAPTDDQVQAPAPTEENESAPVPTSDDTTSDGLTSDGAAADDDAAPAPPAPTGDPVDGLAPPEPEPEPRVLFGRWEVPEWFSADNAVEVTKGLPANAVIALVGLLVFFVLAALVVLT